MVQTHDCRPPIFYCLCYDHHHTHTHTPPLPASRVAAGWTPPACRPWPMWPGRGERAAKGGWKAPRARPPAVAHLRWKDGQLKNLHWFHRVGDGCRPKYIAQAGGKRRATPPPTHQQQLPPPSLFFYARVCLLACLLASFPHYRYRPLFSLSTCVCSALLSLLLYTQPLPSSTHAHFNATRKTKTSPPTHPLTHPPTYLPSSYFLLRMSQATCPMAASCAPVPVKSTRMSSSPSRPFFFPLTFLEKAGGWVGGWMVWMK